MWRWYFGDQLKYVGIDINPTTQRFATPWAEIVIGDTGSSQFWEDFKVTSTHERPDIFLDDGGHTMGQQKMAFNELLDWVKPGGIVSLEDLHTSYWPSRYGGHGNPALQHPPDDPHETFVEFTKRTIDWLHYYR
ncbi:unnamed protein product [Chrysoparadoxa australica]